MRSFVTTFTLALALAGGGAIARDVTDPYGPYRGTDDPGVDYEFDDSLVEQWKEGQVEVPPLSEAGLKPLRIDHGPPGVRFLLDMDTLTVHAEDRVVRYWLVMESGGRYTNVLYEGIRCTDSTYKTYAYASPRRLSLVKHAKDPEWESVRGLGGADFRYELVTDFFCTDVSPRTLEGIAASVAGYVNTNDGYYQDTDFIPR